MPLTEIVPLLVPDIISFFWRALLASAPCAAVAYAVEAVYAALPSPTIDACNWLLDIVRFTDPFAFWPPLIVIAPVFVPKLVTPAAAALLIACSKPAILVCNAVSVKVIEPLVLFNSMYVALSVKDDTYEFLIELIVSFIAAASSGCCSIQAASSWRVAKFFSAPYLSSPSARSTFASSSLAILRTDLLESLPISVVTFPSNVLSAEADAISFSATVTFVSLPFASTTCTATCAVVTALFVFWLNEVDPTVASRPLIAVEILLSTVVNPERSTETVVPSCFVIVSVLLAKLASTNLPL